MKQFYTFAFLLSISITGFAQNWSVFPQSDTIGLLDTNGYLYQVIKDSSQTTSAGEKHFLAPEIEMWNISGSNCVGTPRGSSLLGKIILEANHEVQLIFSGDTLHLPTQISDSASSTFEGVPFYVKLDSILYKNITNLVVDSVKSYSFHLQPFSNLYWCAKDRIVEISKHNGLISFP